MSVKRAVSLVVLALPWLIGPAPGDAGGCGVPMEYADARSFCIERAAIVCSRNRARGDATTEETEACLAAIRTTDCPPGTEWAAECAPPPTVRDAQRCLDALSEVDRIDEEPNAFAECGDRALCGRDVPAGQAR